MTITGQNFDVYQGDNKELIVTVYDENGSILNLAGYNAVWCIHSLTPEHTYVVLKTTGIVGGITIPSPASGQIVISLDSEDTESLTPKAYGHQGEIEDSSGNHATIITGLVKILKSITHGEF
jgi:hypothetical protein